jgi:hypothetical protein
MKPFLTISILIFLFIVEKLSPIKKNSLQTAKTKKAVTTSH